MAAGGPIRARILADWRLKAHPYAFCFWGNPGKEPEFYLMASLLKQLARGPVAKLGSP